MMVDHDMMIPCDKGGQCGKDGEPCLGTKVSTTSINEELG